MGIDHRHAGLDLKSTFPIGADAYDSGNCHFIINATGVNLKAICSASWISTMDSNRPSAESEQPRPNIVVRLADRVVVAVIHLLIALATLKSRDPSEQTRIRNWQGVLQWSPQQRVGCAVGVVIGVCLGGAFLWYSLR